MQIANRSQPGSDRHYNRTRLSTELMLSARATVQRRIHSRWPPRPRLGRSGGYEFSYSVSFSFNRCDSYAPSSATYYPGHFRITQNFPRKGRGSGVEECQILRDLDRPLWSSPERADMSKLGSF